MRTFSQSANDTVKSMLAELTEKPTADKYRDLMIRLGAELAHVLVDSFDKSERILLICTNEDADFLATGILREMDQQGYNKISLACFWNERVRLPKIDVAPIVRWYVEPMSESDSFLVVKSIISSGCVIRTNISELVYEKNPKRIAIVAPVILAGSTETLKTEFETDIANRFEYYWFAQDDEKKSDGEVVPGIGGSVYELLGIGSAEEKNKYIPDLVKTRRSQKHQD